MAKTAKKDLAATLRDMATRVEAGDSFEGRIAYSCMEDGCGEDEFEVDAAWRVGNLDGQGGMQVILPSGTGRS
jgi:hypothetical protein